MLKTTRSSDLGLKAFKANDNKTIRIDGRADKMFKNLFKSKKLKNKKFENLTRIRAIRKPIFLTSEIKKVFNSLSQAFIEALIF